MSNEELQAKINRLEKEIVELKRVRVRRLVYPIVMIFISLFAAVGVNIVYTHKAVSANDQSWCDVVTSLDERYQQLHSTDPAALKFAQQMHTLRGKFHCA